MALSTSLPKIIKKERSKEAGKDEERGKNQKNSIQTRNH